MALVTLWEQITRPMAGATPQTQSAPGVAPDKENAPGRKAGFEGLIEGVAVTDRVLSRWPISRGKGGGSKPVRFA